MIELDNIKSVYFIGIGGIGMSALARYFGERGVKVSGYDRTPTPLTRQLEAAGMAIHYEDDPALADKAAGLVVYTPAVPSSHRELAYYREQGFPVWKRSDVLEAITRTLFSITVAGTHGKTTISSFIAHILRHSGYGCNAFLGGITVNYHTNFWSNARETAVIEADEYDRSFLKLHPDIAVLTAMDPDHLDIYGTPEALEEAFIQYTAQLGSEGLLVYKHGLARSRELKGAKRISYSLENNAADIYAENIRLDNGGYIFSICRKDWMIDNLQLNIGGMHNVENTVAAVAVAHHLGIGNEQIRAAVAAFKGVKRRFEYIVRNVHTVYIDDYAHHPEELRALIQSARSLFPDKQCTVVFQPHLYTRTRDLADGFAESLSLADEVILLPIYPARELPIPGIQSELIAEKIKGDRAKVMDKAGCLNLLQEQRPELLITAGAGDIDQLVQPIKDFLDN
ncbi:UDP-N-acetylmuramate--L-alanine ligase [Compostibacter hankyongensis]|uniref:UDP-N-acetylmuramate--L-alanine ligase n=1 Tax=Compostibacter hankyongensis TaxID=1007089 RepID=A0ABP8FGN2_9BACT